MRRATLLLATTLLMTVTAFAAPHTGEEIRTAIASYRHALVAKDLATLDAIWADDYTFVNGHGKVRTKADRIADIKSGATLLDSIKHEEPPTIQFHGDVAIVSSQVTLTGRYSGREVSGEFRSTHIWIHDQDRWRLLMNQLTPIDAR